MKSPFLITGLPRSRTSWLANLFTTGNQFCYHDLLAKVDSLEHFTDMLAGGRGDSDAGLMLIFPLVKQILPDARWLLVLREPDDCKASLKRLLTGTPDEESAWKSFDNLEIFEKHKLAMVSDPSVHVLTFDELDSFDAVSKAWHFLCPETELSRERFDMLNVLNVQPHYPKTTRPISSKLSQEVGELMAL